MKKSRTLTDGEYALAQTWLPAGIDLASVRIHRGRFFIGQPANVAMTPFGSPYFPEPLYCDDFSQAELPLQALFIHEMVHAWQHQNGVRVALRGLWLHVSSWRYWRQRGGGPRTAAANRNAGGGPYAYTLQAGRPLAAYNIEQQAQIVEDAFRLAQGRKPGFPQAGVRLADYAALVRRGSGGNV